MTFHIYWNFMTFHILGISSSWAIVDLHIENVDFPEFTEDL